jgi:hypothetical protein
MLIPSLLALTLASTPSFSGVEASFPGEKSLTWGTISGAAPHSLSGADGGGRYVPEGLHPFLAAGFSLLGASSLDDLTILRGGVGTAGLEIPTGRWWTFVPRLHVSAAQSGEKGALTWTRLALGGRFSNARESMSSYAEIGLGMGLLNYPLPAAIASSESHPEQGYCGTPFVQGAFGWRGVPDQARVLMVELDIAVGTGVESPAAIEAVVGMEF